MRKITFLLLLLFVAVGAGAKIITTAPVAGTPYKIKCISSDHTGYLGDDGTTLQGRHATGTYFVLEAVEGQTGQYYLKSQESGKYVNAAGTENGAAVSFDTTASTYWTIDQTNADAEKHSWGLRPDGTANVSLNNNGSSDAVCPWMKIGPQTGSSNQCSLWTFDDGEPVPYEKPQFGGTVWTWNTANSNFDAEGQTSTATPGRINGKGSVYKFDNVGNVSITPGTDTSDKGGIWVIGSNSNVTSTLGSWAGSILVEDYAIASVSYGYQLKGTEPDASATVWTNGTLSITGRTDFNMADGGNQRWYIGENGVINTNFASVTMGNNRTWDINVVVADAPARADVARTQMQLKKKVMTWGSDISSNINSVTVWYKDADGNLTKLDNAVTYDATGITVTYTGLGYDEKTPSLPEGQYIKVSDTKADFLTPATAADDNAHWYILTQTRGGESPVYDNGSINNLQRAAAGTNLNSKLIAGNERYLVRFFENGEGLYDIQFATGNFVNHNMKTGNYAAGGAFNLYKISDAATHIGWNKAGFTDRVDNNGVGADVLFYGSGLITSTGGNNDWSLYPVEFIDGVTVNYTIHSDVLNEDYTGSYITGWAGDNTALPVLGGAAGYSLTDAVFVENGGVYSVTAKITFPFPVSNATVQNATGIESALGNSKWVVNDAGNIIANNAANTTLTYASQDNFKWYIYPSFSEGTFSFKIKHSTGKYIPTITAAQNANTTNAAVEAADAGSYYFMPCIGNGKGFSINAEGTIFLTVNTSGANQNVWAWTKGGSHQGSNLSFPDVTITKEGVKAQFDVLKNAAPFDILEGSTVQGPSEFANPTEINAAIAAAQEVDTDDVAAMETFCSSSDGQKIKNYLDQVATYGELYTYPFEVTRQYSTLILPCPSTLPAGITLYTCSATEENGVTLQLSPVSGNIAQNVPYIIESTVGNKYTIIGWLKNHEDTHTSGWLTGVLAEGGALVPEGGYALAYQKSTGKQGFFKTDGTVTCPQHKCYLTPAVEQAAKAFYFDNNGGTTAIEDIFGGNDGKMEIYDLSGRRLQSLQKGVNIVNGRKVLVK